MFNKEQLQRFSIRKLTVGAASVLIGVLFLTSWNTNTVYADSINVTSGESIAKNNNPQEGNPAVNKDNVQIVDNDSTEVSNISDSKSSKVIKSDATKSDIVRDKTTIDDNSGTKVPEHTAQANNKQALTTVTEDNGAKVSKTEKYSNSDIKKQPKNSEKTQETTLVKKVLDKEKLSSESLIEEKLSSESLRDPKKLDGKVEIRATDPSNYPTEINGLKLNGLIGKDKYIYQVLSLDGYSRSKLILSVNRNDPNDKNIYAYVIHGNYNYYDGNYDYNSVEKPIIIGKDEPSIITIDGRKYRLNNNGSSEVFIGNKVVSTQNSSTVTSEPWYFDNTPIGQVYGLGNTSKDKCTDIGEIVPVFTENSVIKYYYSDNEGNLTEIENSPNVIVDGFTGQEFEIKDVDRYKKVIQGYYLTSDNLPQTGDFKGTLSQFSEDKYYKKVYYDFDTDRVEHSVLYHQISPDGTMEVWLLDHNGSLLTKSKRVIAPNTSTEYSNYNLTVRNPYVTATSHEVQFIYKKLGSIIPVDENGKQIGDAIQFENNPDDPTKALPGKVPSISGYHPKYGKVGDTVDPDSKDLSKDIEVEYVKSSTISVVYHDNTSDKDLSVKKTTGDEGTSFNYNPATDLATLEGKGYVLDEKDNKVPDIPTEFTATDQIVTIHLKHGTHTINQTTSPKQTVHYVYADGLVRQGKAADDNVQQLSFKRDGYNDEVTGVDHWNAWTPANSNYKAVDSPVIQGYTPDKSVIEKSTANPTDKDTEITVTYNADKQTIKIKYIDDTTGDTLKQDKLDGTSDQDAKYTTSDSIQHYTDLHYKLVSDSTNGQDLIFDHDDKADQTYEVHFAHGTHTINQTTSPKQTVHYVYADGLVRQGKAADDNVQQLSFKRDGYNDEVTGVDHWNAWTPANSNYKAVDSPVIQGYTPDKSVIEKSTANPTDKDTEITVTYNADKQTIKIKYIDDTTGDTLKQDKLDGTSDQDAKYTTSDSIQHYTDLHYKLVSDSTNGQDLIFDHDDKADQTYEVHFAHGTHTINQTTSPKQTVHYVYADGLVRQGKAADDNVQQLSFKRDGYNDEVTGVDHWNAWTPANSNYKAVDSPVIQGYTPDKSVIEKSTANPTDKDTEITVTYNADKQTIKIKYIDDTTGDTLKQDKLDGTSDQDAKYTTSDSIQHYTDLHYKLVSDSTNGQDLIFDHDDKADQTYEVHFAHGTHTINQTTSPKQTVHYVYADGLVRQGKAADDNVQQLSFKRDGYNDEVTGVDHWNAWTPANSNYKAVDSPVIQGYTPDKSVIEKSTANPTDKDTEITVTYNADKQTIKIKYIDDTTGDTLKQDKLDGTSDQDAKYTTSDSIQHYTDLHYKLVSDSTNGQDLIFDHDDKADQTYEVHFAHGTHTINQTTSPKQTVHYVYADGLVRQGKAADDNVQQLSFKRDGYNDEVTGVDHWNAWTPANSNYKAVDSPVIQGYTPDKSVIEKSTANPTDKDTEITVTYNADKQTIKIKYIDDTTGDTLKQDKLDGTSDQDAKYTTSDSIQHYTDLHYKLVSDSTNGQDLIFDHDDKADQTYEVHFAHGTHTINQTTSPKQTVHYVYADGLVRQGKAADDNVQQLSFKRDGYNDEVTGVDHWNAWTPANSNYKAVDSPVIQGYTPDKSVIEKSTANPTDKDTEITVTYNADKQTIKIKYIDDTTGDTLKQDKLDGTSDQDAKYTTSDSIQHYTDLHYKLVSDSTNGQDLIFDHDDKADQTYEVHFAHGTQKVNRQDTVTSTIDYKFEDGKTAQPTVTQTKHFSEDGVKDLVTGKIAWDEAKPQKFDDVATPAISGYTPDKDNVAGSTVKFGDKDIEVTVTYHNNVQTAKITYIDDTEKKTLGSDKQNGKFNQAIIFEHDPAEVIKGLEEKGYKLVSDNFKPGIKYQNDNKFNIFEVHLVHTYEPVETSQTITETVHYIDANGKPVAPDHVAKVVIKVTGTRDKVTDSIIWNTPSTGHFDEVISPEVPNMTPDKKLIPGRDVQYGDSDITESVVYTPDNSTSKTPEKPDKPSKEVSKTPEKPNKPSKEVSKIPEKPNKSSKEVSKAPEKSTDSRTVDNHVSAKSTAKRELPQTGATTNTGIWTGLVSMIASLGLLGASKRRKKN